MRLPHVLTGLWVLLLLSCTGLSEAQRNELSTTAGDGADAVAMGPRFPRLNPRAPKQPPAATPSTPQALSSKGSDTSKKAAGTPTFDERKKTLGTDPRTGYREHEGQVGAEIEHQYGGFKRDSSGVAEWISLSGPYKDKTFDLLGIPPGKASFHDSTLKNFLPSLDDHFRKSVDYVVLDARSMTAEQKKTLTHHIDMNWKSQKHRLIMLP
jgi:hypothetical protein